MIVMLLPEGDFDPTESALPWDALMSAGHEVTFATPNGERASADERLITTGFGPLSALLMTRKDALETYRRMEQDPRFNRPKRYAEVLEESALELLIIPGGHAPRMKSMLESDAAQKLVAAQFARNAPVAAVCHGVLLVARAGVLRGRKTTALTRAMEMSAWAMTKPFLGDYYRTYPKTVQDEVEEALAGKDDFLAGPLIPRRDTAEAPGFVVRDGAYVSARWPGDCYAFARACVELVS